MRYLIAVSPQPQGLDLHKIQYERRWDFLTGWDNGKFYYTVLFILRLFCNLFWIFFQATISNKYIQSQEGKKSLVTNSRHTVDNW